MSVDNRKKLGLGVTPIYAQNFRGRNLHPDAHTAIAAANLLWKYCSCRGCTSATLDIALKVPNPAMWTIPVAILTAAGSRRFRSKKLKGST